MFNIHQRNVEDAGDEDEWKHDVVGQVKRRMPLDFKRQIGFPHCGEHLPCSFNRSLCPSELLCFQRVNFGREFGRRRNIFQKFKFPPAQLCTVAQVEIFRQGIRVPVPGVFDTCFSPHTARAVKIDEEACLVADRLFDHKMSVQCHCLSPCEERVPRCSSVPSVFEPCQFFCRHKNMEEF